MMPLSNFSNTQEYYINDKIALNENDEHKLQLQRTRLHNFFIAHKKYEW